MEQTTHPAGTRRAVLGWLVGGAVLAAGCSVESEGPPDGTVHCYNQTNFSRSVEVRVATADGERLLDATFEVPPGERRTSDVVLERPGDYDVTATTGEDRSARTLTFPAADGGDGGTGDGTGVRGYVRVAVSRDGVLVSRAGLR